jgi:cis-3-alkyl-4-acyloxetan-2-one decarboxylase
MVIFDRGAIAAMNSVLQKFLADHPGRDFDRGGLKLHYLDEGSGEPIVMLTPRGRFFSGT